VNVDARFLKPMRAEIDTEPRVLKAKNQAAKRHATFSVKISEKDFNFNVSVVERVEDVFDEISVVTEPFQG
jgi:hypothetical protein